MARRRFGPQLGAGVAIVEEESEKQIQPASLGVTAYTGITEKGPLDRLILCNKKKVFLAKCGSYTPDSQLPDAAFDFFNLGNGKGELHVQRITDGTHKDAKVVLYSRHLDVRKPVIEVHAGFAGVSNPGRWAGKKQDIVGEYTAVGTNTLDTGKTMLENEFKDALLTLSAVPGKSFKVVSNTTAGVLTFETDVDLTTELGGSANQLYKLSLSNEGKAVAVKVLDGEDDPANEFGLEFYVDGVLTKRYPNLSMDPNSARYFVNVINDDTSNYCARVVDVHVGTVTPASRPANHAGESLAVTATTLQAKIFQLQSTLDDGTAVASIGTPAFGGSVLHDTLTLVCTDDTTPGSAVFSVTSALQGALAALTEDVAYTSNEFSMDFTLTNSGAGNFTAGDTIVITLFPLPVNGLVGQTLVPDHANNRRTKFEIVSNTFDTITVKAGSDMTTVAAAGELFLVESLTELGGGYDGVEGIVDATYLQAYDTSTSVLRNLLGKKKGLVKLATPGVTSVAVQKQGASFAEANNWQYRYEIPANITDEQSAEEYLNGQLGRNDFAKVHWPSYAYVTNPQGEGLKLVTMTGAFHGREAKVANDYGGYHKIAGGIDVTLPNIVKLPTGDRQLDHEFLNPQGINIIDVDEGNFVMWGARSVSIDPAFRFVQHREQLSHYENTFRDSYKFIIFAIQSPANRERLRTSFIAFFQPEFAKGAIQGSTFGQAVSIKIDDENNPPEETSAGNLNAEIKVRIADTVERFVITMSKAGIFEDLEAA